MTTAEKIELRAIVYASLKSALAAPKQYSRNSAGGSSLSVTGQDIEALQAQLDRLDADIAMEGGTVARTVYVRPQDA